MIHVCGGGPIRPDDVAGLRVFQANRASETYCDALGISEARRRRSPEGMLEAYLVDDSATKTLQFEPKTPIMTPKQGVA